MSDYELHCVKCGHTWERTKLIESKCPNCGKELFRLTEEQVKYEKVIIFLSFVIFGLFSLLVIANETSMIELMDAFYVFITGIVIILPIICYLGYKYKLLDGE